MFKKLKKQRLTELEKFRIKLIDYHAAQLTSDCKFIKRFSLHMMANYSKLWKRFA